MQEAAMISGNGWAAVFEDNDGNDVTKPVVLWSRDAEDGEEGGAPVGYVLAGLRGSANDSVLAPATQFKNFVEYRQAESEEGGDAQFPLREEDCEGRWVEVELTTGRRFVGRYAPDDNPFGADWKIVLFAFALRGSDGEEGDSVLFVQAGAIVSIQVLGLVEEAE